MHKKNNFISRWDALAIFVFIILSFFLITHHEPWRDEAQTWLLVRDSPDLVSLFSNMRYEPSPALWNVLLYPLTRLGLPYYSMAILHFLIALCSVVIFLLFAPFKKCYKLLFIFGYFLLYEYNVIARNYAISVLLLFCIASLYKKRFSRQGVYLSLIFLLSNANAYSLVIAVMLFLSLLFEHILLKRKKVSKKFFMLLFIFALLFLLPFLQLTRPEDHEYRNKKIKPDLSVTRLGLLSYSFVESFLPLPQLTRNFWQDKRLLGRSNLVIVWGFPFFLFSLLFVVHSLQPFLIYLGSSLGLFFIMLSINVGSIRHHGFFFIMFIFSLWIAKESSNSGAWYSFARKVSLRKFTYFFLIVLLGVHLMASAVAGYYELKYEFSSSKKAAAFLLEQDLVRDDIMIVSYQSSQSNAISPYLPSDYRFYCLEYGHECSFIVFNKKHQRERRPELIGERAKEVRELIAGDKEVVFVLSPEDYGARLRLTEDFELIGSFNQSIVYEHYYIYQRKE